MNDFMTIQTHMHRIGWMDGWLDGWMDGMDGWIIL